MRASELLKWLAVVSVAVGFAAFASVRGEDPKQTAPRPKPADEAVPGKRILLLREDGFAVLNPAGKELLTGNLTPSDRWAHWGWLSSDGKRLAYLLSISDSERQPRVMVRDLDGGKFATSIDVNAMYLLWHPDGRSLVATSYVTDIWEPLKTEHVRIDLIDRKVSKLDWPDDIVPVDWSADGKTLVVVGYGKRPTGHIGLMTADGKKVTKLIDLRSADDWSGAGRRLSPDGKKLLFADAPPEGPHRHGMVRRLYLLDIATKKVTEVRDVPKNAIVYYACWSPDGKQIAYTWQQQHTELLKEWAKKPVLDPEDYQRETESFLIVADADGSNPKTIVSEKANSVFAGTLQAIDWR